MELEIISMINIDGEWINQNELPTEQANKMIAETLDRAMGNIGFKRKKPLNIYRKVE